MDRDGVGARTAQTAHAVLRATLEDAVREQITPRNVARLARPPRPGPRQNEASNPDEARALLKAVRVVLGVRGVPPRTVIEIAGHSTMEMTMMMYSHVSLKDKRAALDQLGDLLDGHGEQEHPLLSSGAVKAGHDRPALGVCAGGVWRARRDSNP
jgi:hypothetical protein